MALFARYIGIDYSGAETPTASLRGLRVYLAEEQSTPAEVLPKSGLRKYWTRNDIANWLIHILSEDTPTLVGIDHAFSFPLRYFEAHQIEPDWSVFLDDFQRHWPTDEDNTYVDFVRSGSVGDGGARMGNARWRRLTEERAGGAKSVFHFDVPGSVAKSSHAGIPWLRTIRRRLGGHVHFWPFDGWDVAIGRRFIAEVYPSLWSSGWAREDRTADQHDAFCVAAWMQRADWDETLRAHLTPDLAPHERTVVRAEGWILGVGGHGSACKGNKLRRSKSSLCKTGRRKPSRRTTEPGYINKSGQAVLLRTSIAGNDHNQFVYVLRCSACQHEYGANGSDIWQRKCLECGGGAPGLGY